MPPLFSARIPLDLPMPPWRQKSTTSLTSVDQLVGFEPIVVELLQKDHPLLHDPCVTVVRACHQGLEDHVLGEVRKRGCDVAPLDGLECWREFITTWGSKIASASVRSPAPVDLVGEGSPDDLDVLLRHRLRSIAHGPRRGTKGPLNRGPPPRFGLRSG